MATENYVRSLERALSILECFSREKPTRSLMDISRELGLSPSTVSRMIATLEGFGYLRRDAGSLQYSLGYKLANLGAICLSTTTVCEIAHPHLLTLRDYFNESVGLFVVDRNERVCVDFVPSTMPVHYVLSVGTRRPLTRGAAGKLLLSDMEPEIARQLLLNSASCTSFDQLPEIKKQGYAVSVNESNEGLTSVAVAVYNAERSMEAAIFISGPLTRFDEPRIYEMVQMCQEEAGKISVKLGY